MDGEPTEVRYALPVRDLELHRPGALAVDLDHEAAEVLGLGERALDRGPDAVAVAVRTAARKGSTSSWEKSSSKKSRSSSWARRI